MWFEAHCKSVSMKWVVLEVHWYQFPKLTAGLVFFGLWKSSRCCYRSEKEVDRKKMALITADALKLKKRSEKLGGGAGDHKRWMECTFVMGGGGVGSSNNT
jgi:hypothetical protein